MVYLSLLLSLSSLCPSTLGRCIHVPRSVAAGTAPPRDRHRVPRATGTPKAPVLLPGLAAGSDRWSLCPGVSLAGPSLAPSSCCPTFWGPCSAGLTGAGGGTAWPRARTPAHTQLCSAGCPGSALARMTCPQGGVDVPKGSGGCAAQIAPPLCDPGTHGAGIWVWGQQGPNPPQSLTCCRATLATLPVPVTGWGSSQPSQTHPWVGGGRRWGRGGASPSRCYIGTPPCPRSLCSCHIARTQKW